MSTATLEAPLFVQTHFNWDEEPTPALATSNPTIARKGTSAPSRHSQSTQSKDRIGGCTHVGAPLVKVLSKYGFTLDDLLVEIERQKQLAS